MSAPKWDGLILARNGALVYTTSIFIWLLYEWQLEEKNVSKRLMKDQKMAKK